MKRTTSLVLVLAMLFTAMLGVISFGEGETEATPVLEVSQANLEFGNAVYLYIAVDHSQFETVPAITLKITNNKTGDEVVLSPSTAITAPTNCVAFKYDDLGAKNMGDELTIQALKDGEPSGEPKTYSILEYALKAQAQGDAKLSALMVAMLAYGANAQTVYSHQGTYDLSKTWGLVVVSGANEGKIIAEAGQPAPFTPNTAKTGANPVLYDMSLNKIEGSLTVPAGASTFVYVGDAQKTMFHMDITKANDDLAKTAVKTNEGQTKSVYPTIYFNSSSFGTGTLPSGTLGKDFCNLNANLYPVTTASGRGGEAGAELVTGENGYWKVYTSGQQSLAIQMGQDHDALVRGIESGVFTYAMTLGKDGLGEVFNTAFRFRGSSSGNSANFLLAGNSGSVTNFYTVNNNSKTSTVFCSIDGEEGVQKFVTIYIVVDINNNTLTYYNNQNDNVYTTSAPTAANKTLKDVFGVTAGANNGSFIDWTAATALDKHVLIRNMAIFEGNIFE